MVGQLRKDVILDLRSCIAVKSDSTVDFLSDGNLVGNSVSVVGARVADSNVWITESLCLADS